MEMAKLAFVMGYERLQKQAILGGMLGGLAKRYMPAAANYAKGAVKSFSGPGIAQSAGVAAGSGAMQPAAQVAGAAAGAAGTQPATGAMTATMKPTQVTGATMKPAPQAAGTVARPMQQAASSAIKPQTQPPISGGLKGGIGAVGGATGIAGSAAGKLTGGASKAAMGSGVGQSAMGALGKSSSFNPLQSGPPQFSGNGSVIPRRRQSPFVESEGSGLNGAAVLARVLQSLQPSS